MSQKQSLIFILGAIVVLFVLFMMGSNAKKSYFTQMQTLASFEKDAKSLASLKGKFSDKNAAQRSIKTLVKIAPVSKDFKKGDTRVLIYENLAASTLNNLLRKIGNSTLIIKKLEINRLNAQSASLRLELKK